MNKLTWTIGAALIALGAYGCGGTCGTFCDYLVECYPDVAEYQGYSSCKWEDGDDEALDRCGMACDDSMDRLSDRERETVEACIDCLDEELGGECRDGDDYVDAMQDCDNDCYDEDFGEFWSEFFEDMDDLECRG